MWFINQLFCFLITKRLHLASAIFIDQYRPVIDGILDSHSCPQLARFHRGEPILYICADPAGWTVWDCVVSRVPRGAGQREW
jgi:hypothetical protein